MDEASINKVQINSTPVTVKKTVEQLAQEVLAGKWGNGEARKTALKKAGYDYTKVQAAVNKLVAGKTTVTPKKTNQQIAKEVIAGKWGNGATRKKQLTESGYDYNTIQKLVNKML